VERLVLRRNGSGLLSRISEDDGVADLDSAAPALDVR
jgi:hypothetical protein